MVNKIILDYLSEYAGKYKLEDLRKKIISSGYHEKDVDEAIQALGLKDTSVSVTPATTTPVNNIDQVNSGQQKPQTQNVSQTQQQTQPQTQQQTQPTSSTAATQVQEPKKGFKWMKFAGIIGIVFLILIILSIISGVILSFVMPNIFTPNLEDINAENGSALDIGSLLSLGIAAFIIAGIVYTIMLVFWIFFVFGFVKMGKYVNSKLLRFASISIIILLIVLTILIVVYFVFFSTFLINLASGAIDSAIQMPGNFTVNGGEEASSGSNSLGLIIGILILGILLFCIIVVFLFFIGLIIAGKEVKFAKSSGIFGLLLIILMIILPIIFIIMLVSNPISFFLFLVSATGLTLILILSLGISLLSLLVLFLMSMSLLKASKKFEALEVGYP